MPRDSSNSPSSLRPNPGGIALSLAVGTAALAGGALGWWRGQARCGIDAGPAGSPVEPTSTVPPEFMDALALRLHTHARRARRRKMALWIAGVALGALATSLLSRSSVGRALSRSRQRGTPRSASRPASQPQRKQASNTAPVDTTIPSGGRTGATQAAGGPAPSQH